MMSSSVDDEDDYSHAAETDEGENRDDDDEMMTIAFTAVSITAFSPQWLLRTTTSIVETTSHFIACASPSPVSAVWTLSSTGHSLQLDKVDA